jgi:hypothetical protein
VRVSIKVTTDTLEFKTAFYVQGFFNGNQPRALVVPTDTELTIGEVIPVTLVLNQQV